MTPRTTGIIALLTGIVLTLSLSRYFYITGEAHWQQQAQAEMERISELLLFQLQLAYEPMLGLSMLMQGSQEVTQTEFEDALRLTQQDDPNVQRTAYAFVTQHDNDILVQLSSNNQTLVLQQQQLGHHAALKATLARAEQRPQAVTAGPIFVDNNGLHKVFLAIDTHSQSASGYMLALVDIDSLLQDMHAQQVPRGLRCQLQTPETSVEAPAATHPGAYPDTNASPVSYHIIDATLGGQPWQLAWQLYPEYQGGHASRLSIVVIVTGVMISLLTGLLAYLWRTHRQRAKQLDNAYQTLQSAMQQMIKSEKMASLGSLVAGIAHEMNTPVGNSLTVATALRERAREFGDTVQAGILKKSILTEFLTTLDEATELIEKNTRRAAQLVGNFKQVAVDQSSERRRKFDLRQAVDETLWTLEPTLKHSLHRIAVDIPTAIQCDSYPGAIGQIITNLVSNSVQHGFENTSEGHIDIRGIYQEGDIFLHYVDDGCGIPEEHLKKVFDPFFTTKLGQGGSGLGLHIIYNLVTGLLGGDVSIESSPGHGVHITMHFPAIAPAKHDTRIANG